MIDHSETVSLARVNVMTDVNGEKSKRKGRGAIRSYELALYANPGKKEQTLQNMRLCQWLTMDYIVRYFGKAEDATESTEGLGLITNQAFKRARDILRAGRNASIATGEQFHCPRTVPLLCDGIIRESKTTTHFEYWVKTPTGPWLPAQPHRALNNALRQGGVLRPYCEVRQGKKGGLVARIFVEFGRLGTKNTGDYLGCDVGVNVGVARSDGYIGKSLRPVLIRTREKRAEQQRQEHRKTSARSACKQFLDREARRTVNVCLRGGKTLVLESPNALGNLRPSGSIGAWARQHFAVRCLDLAEVSGVAIRFEWPAGTSITCRACSYRDKKNRSGISFVCRQCGARGHADLIAARNLADRARGNQSNVRLIEKAALQTRSGGRNKTS